MATSEKVLSLDPETVQVKESGDSRSTSAMDNFADINVAEVGQLQPGIVEKIEGVYYVLAGRRRLAAIRAHNKGRKQENRLPFLAVERSCKDDLERFMVAVDENDRRKALSPVDYMHVVHELKTTHNLDVDQIAAKLGKKARWVYNCLDLAKLDARTLKLVHAGTLGFESALLLVDVPEDQRKAIVEKLNADAEAAYEAAKKRAEAAEKKAEAEAEAKAKAAAAKTAAAEAAEAEKGAKSKSSKTKTAKPAKSAKPAKTKPAPNKPKIAQRSVQQAVAQSTGKIKAPDRAGIQKFFESLTGPGEPKPLRDSSVIVLDFIGGTISLESALDKVRAVYKGK